jgi:hypothetical protein
VRFDQPELFYTTENEQMKKNSRFTLFNVVS